MASKYTRSQIDWLEENAPNMYCSELKEKFNAHFGTNRTLGSIRMQCNRKGFALKPRCNLPAGTEIAYSNNGQHDEIRVKVCRHAKQKTAWQLKQEVVWEQHNQAKLPGEWLVVFLNGDKTDFSKENLYAVSRRVHAIMAASRWYSKCPELTFVCIKIAELQDSLKLKGLIGENEQYGNLETQILCENKLRRG
jgi:hypothetical protein